jgi:hypothetical protein
MFGRSANKKGGANAALNHLFVVIARLDRAIQ